MAAKKLGRPIDPNVGRSKQVVLTMYDMHIRALKRAAKVRDSSMSEIIRELIETSEITRDYVGGRE